MDNYFDTGLIRLEEGAYTDAIDLFTKALRLALGDLADILMYRGVAYTALQDYVRAMADFDASLEQNPDHAETYLHRGNVLRFRNQFREALQDYTFALMIDESFAEARYNRALCYEELALYDEAERDLVAVITQDPSIAPAYEARGRVRAARHDYDNAILDLQRYLRMGGGREYDNHSETQAFIIALRVEKMIRQVLRRKD